MAVLDGVQGDDPGSGVQRYELSCDTPGWRFIDPIDRMIGNTHQRMAQVRLRAHVDELGRADQRVYGCGPFAAGAGGRKQEFLPFKRRGAQGAHGGIIVDNAVVTIVQQCLPLIQDLLDRVGRIRLAQEQLQLLP